jgi:hypothetical protein
MGPEDAGDDLERLLNELQAKGWPPEKLRATRERWEDVCYDPMRRGRGGKGIPENERKPETPPVPPLIPERKPDLAEILDRTTNWPGPPPDVGAN